MSIWLSKIIYLLTGLFVIGLVSACSPDPSVTFEVGEVLLSERFDDGAGWDNQQSGQVIIGTEASAYRIQSNVHSFVRGFYRNAQYDNVVIDVRGTQLSQHDNTAFGIICRAEATDRRAGGYYFLIGADGTYSIRAGRQDQVIGLIKWARSGAINKGVATNDIRAVCIDDYLALYINGEFVAEVHDDTYQRGSIALTAAVESGELIQVAFDDLVVLEGRIP